MTAKKRERGTHLKRKVIDLLAYYKDIIIDLLAYYKHIKLNRTTTGRPVLEKTADQNVKFTICDILNRTFCDILNREYLDL